MKEKKYFTVGVSCEVVDYRTVEARSEKEAIKKALECEQVIQYCEGDLDWSRDEYAVDSIQEVLKDKYTDCFKEKVVE